MLFQRTLFGAAVIGLFSLPYWMSSSPEKSGGSGAPHEATPFLLDTPSLTAPLLSSSASGAASDLSGPAGPQLPPTAVSLEEALRFEITPAWVMHRWPLVSTTTNQPELKGYRVTLVTGGGSHDLAGSLTYYFNADGQLQRIVFHGSTGDARPLVRFVQDKFAFRRETTPDAGVEAYQVHWHGKVVSDLRVQPAPVVVAQEPRRRFLVNLLIERPDPLRWFTDGPRKMSELKL